MTTDAGPDADPSAGSTEVEGGLDDPTELEPEQGTLRLAGDDGPEPATRADWEAAAAAVLRKARRMGDDDPDDGVWAALARTTLDGIDVAPLGTPELVEGLQTAGRPPRQGEWGIRAHHGPGAGDETRNAEVLVDLEGGVTSLWLAARPDTDWSTLLDGVLLDLAPVVLDGDEAESVALAEAFLDHVGDAELHPGTQLGVPAHLATAELAARARDRGVLAFVVDGTTVHDRGASDAQELGWTMATAVAHLRLLDTAGLGPEVAAGLVEFRYAVTDDQFASIAKLRAARRLWSRVLELCGVEPADQPAQRQHAVTSRPMMSRYDPYVNLLRTTVAGFAAGVGGADTVTVLPFDAPLGRPEKLGRRIARNTSALLVSESHLSRVADPAGGAYAVERLTDDLAVAAWTELGRLETEADDPDPGDAFEQRVAEVAQARTAQVATRKRPMTGLSEFPQVDEELPERTPDGAWDDVRPWGAGFEALRDDPPTGRVFLATLGTVAAHTARATFAHNLLAAGGVGVDAAGATDGVQALVAAYDGQPVVCLAGTDAAYAEWGEQAATALRDAGATRVLVAGKPTDFTDDAAAVGGDALAFLTRTREALA